jgi:hypothetical protein
LSAAYSWSFGAALIAWLLVMPGSMVIDTFFGLNERALYTFIIAACSLLVLTIITGCVYDMQRPSSVELRSAMSG